MKYSKVALINIIIVQLVIVSATRNFGHCVDNDVAIDSSPEHRGFKAYIVTGYNKYINQNISEWYLKGLSILIKPDRFVCNDSGFFNIHATLSVFLIQIFIRLYFKAYFLLSREPGREIPGPLMGQMEVV